jgi:acyl dehydratase
MDRKRERAGNRMERRGRFFEDYTVGERIQHWPGRTIRDADDTWFTLLTMNTNPLHFDEHYASQTQHGRCLVNGVLVFAIAVGMSVADMSLNAIANLEYEIVKHLAPTFHGDTLYSESTVLAKSESQSKPDRGVLYVETRCWNQRDETVLTLRRRILMAKRS